MPVETHPIGGDSETMVLTVSGFVYCGECYEDIKDPCDRDLDMYVSERLASGTCNCCGYVVASDELSNPKEDNQP